MTLICLAIDTADRSLAGDLCRRLGSIVDVIKLGLEFFVAHGPAGVEAVCPLGVPLFLDLKLHDIPNTVAAAVRSVAPLRPHYITVHASGGRVMLEAAATAARQTAVDGQRVPRLLAVTVLTSLSAAELSDTGIRGSPAEAALRLARLARSAGIGGVVTSAAEAAALRHDLGPEFFLVTPGIRPVGSGVDDQRRSATPAEAALAGADMLVIGRPVIAAKDPVAAVAAIRQEIQAARRG